jgi:hypothetical protein
MTIFKKGEIDGAKTVILVCFVEIDTGKSKSRLRRFLLALLFKAEEKG